MSLATLLLLADGRLPSGGHAHSGGLEAQISAGRVRDVAGLDGFLRGRLATGGLVAAAFAAAACRRRGDWAGLDDGLDARTPSPALRKASRAQGRALMRTGRAMWPATLGAPAQATRQAAAPREVHQPAALGQNAPATRQAAAPREVHQPTALGPNPQAAAPREVHQPAALGPNPPATHQPAPGPFTAPRDPHQPVALGLLAAAAGLGPAEAAIAAAYGTVTGPAGAAVRLLGLDPYAVHGLLARLTAECDRIAANAAARADDPVDELPAAGAPLLDIGAELHATWEVRLFAS